MRKSEDPPPIGGAKKEKGKKEKGKKEKRMLAKNCSSNMISYGRNIKSVYLGIHHLTTTTTSMILPPPARGALGVLILEGTDSPPGLRRLRKLVLWERYSFRHDTVEKRSTAVYSGRIFAHSFLFSPFPYPSLRTSTPSARRRLQVYEQNISSAPDRPRELQTQFLTPPLPLPAAYR